MDEELTIEQINEMSVALEHQKEVIALQKDIIALLRRVDASTSFRGAAGANLAGIGSVPSRSPLG